MKYRSLAASALFISMIVNAATTQFSYNTNTGDSKWFGYKLKENYDVAICIDDPFYEGAKILSLSVEIPDAEGIANTRGWLSTKLKTSGGKNVPDITMCAGTVSNGILTVVFDEPYTITADPVYIGYSFDITELTEKTKYPVSVAKGDNQNGLYIHSSRSKMKWVQATGEEKGGIQSRMTVTLEGDFYANSAKVSLDNEYVALTGRENTFNARIVNAGSEEIRSIDYSYTLGGNHINGSYTFDSPIPAVYNASGLIPVTLPAFDTADTLSLFFKIDKVNGEECRNLGSEATAQYILTPRFPVNRPLVDEFTGLWCGFCPRGYVALENLAEKYGDLFVAVSWHARDAMQAVEEKDFPYRPSGYPDACINRKYAMNPSEIYTEWEPVHENKVLVDISSEIALDEITGKLNATATICPITNIDLTNYKLAYILVADGLSDPSWLQSNYYANDAGNPEEMPGKLGELFLNGDEKMQGLIFNDVAISGQGIYGVDGSLPESLKAFEEYSFTFDFNLDDTAKIWKDINKLRVIAAIIDNKKGYIMNCASSRYLNGSTRFTSLGKIIPEEGKTVVSTEKYNFQGLPIRERSKGFAVILEHYSDGTMKSRKTFIK